MLIALASVKGSPGVTTFGLALAARWPGDACRVLVECDPAGGDIASRFGLPLSPGLISLAAATRGSTNPDSLWQHTQTLPDGTAVVVGPLRPDQVRTACNTLIGESPAAIDGNAASSLFRAAADSCDGIVVVDCGRLDPGSAALPIIETADVLLVLVRPRADELSRLAAQLDDIASLARRVGLVLAGPGYPPGDVAGELEVPIFATMPDMQQRYRSSRFAHARARARLHRAAVTISRQLAKLAEDHPHLERPESEPKSHDGAHRVIDKRVEGNSSAVPHLTSQGRR